MCPCSRLRGASQKKRRRRGGRVAIERNLGGRFAGKTQEARGARGSRTKPRGALRRKKRRRRGGRVAVLAGHSVRVASAPKMWPAPRGGPRASQQLLAKARKHWTGQARWPNREGGRGGRRNNSSQASARRLRWAKARRRLPAGGHGGASTSTCVRPRALRGAGVAPPLCTAPGRLPAAGRGGRDGVAPEKVARAGAGRHAAGSPPEPTEP